MYIRVYIICISHLFYLYSTCSSFKSMPIQEPYVREVRGKSLVNPIGTVNHTSELYQYGGLFDNVRSCKSFSALLAYRHRRLQVYISVIRIYIRFLQEFT